MVEEKEKPTDINQQDMTLVGKPPGANAPSVESKQMTVKIHGVAEVPEAWFWSAHVVSGSLVLLAVLMIVFAKGPTRLDALKSFRNMQNTNQDKANETAKS